MGLRQRRDHCSEPLLPLLPRSPRAGEEEGERAPQTHPCPLVEVGEVGQGRLLLEDERVEERKRNQKEDEKNMRKGTREKRHTDKGLLVLTAVNV